MQTLADSIGSDISEILRGMTVQQTAGCTKCDEGYIVDFKSQGLPRVVGECDCMAARKAEKLAEWKKAETEKLINHMLPRYDLRKTKIKPFYEKIPQGSCWLWGVTGGGKTHAVGWALAREIKNAESKFKWGIYNATEIIDAWDHQDDYSDDIWKNRSRNLIDKIDGEDSIIINEIEKFGNMTDNRWSKFFSLANRIVEKGKRLRVTSQFPIAYFVARMEKEREVKERDGIGPQEYRFLELVQNAEVEVKA